jgi:Tol biopolymer transport system component
MKRKWKVFLIGLLVLSIMAIILNYEYIQNRKSGISIPEHKNEESTPEHGTEELLEGKILFLSNREGSAAIYIMNADGSNQTKLISNSQYSIEDFAVSPDGKKIVYSAPGCVEPDGWKEDIYIINIDGSGLVKLTEDPERDINPSWSPDGKKIAFASKRDGIFNIYVMNADGSNQTRLTVFNALQPAWSPDGKKIAFILLGDVYVMNADGSNQTRLTNSRTQKGYPAWLPDGKKIAFVLDKDLYLIDANGRNLIRLTYNGAISDFRRPIAWSPDGRKIAFTSNCEGSDQIYVMNADGTNQIKLTKEGRNWSPCWMPNS